MHPPADPAGNDQRKKLINRLKDDYEKADVAVAKQAADGTYGIAVPDSGGYPNTVDDCPDAEGCAIIASVAELHGVRATGRVVSWDANESLAIAVLEAYRELIRTILAAEAPDE